jgi:hypothetical protein
MITIQAIVARAETSGDIESAPTPLNGNRKYSSRTPLRNTKPAASSCPESLTGAFMPFRSSITPRTKMIAVPMRIAISSEAGQRRAGRNDSLNGGIVEANSIAPRKPANIAVPPSVGVGTACTLRSLGTSTAPILRLNRSVSGVAA